MHYSLGQKVLIVSNPNQPWTVGKVGVVERVETEIESGDPS